MSMITATARPMIRDVQKAVAAEFGISLEELLTPTRTVRLARPRQVAMFLAEELTGRKRSVIADAFRRDWKAIKEGVSRIGMLIEADPDLSLRIERLRLRIGTGAPA